MQLSIKKLAALPILGALMLSLVSFAPAIASANEGISGPTSPTVSLTDGKALVRGAKVTSVSGNTINASVTWGSTVMNYTVNTDTNTKFYNRLGRTGAFADIVSGDSISFAGTLSGNGLTVLATAVKDMSGSVTNATISGKVQSIDTGALSLVISKGKDEHNKSPNLKITTNASTIITLNGSTLAFSSIQSGDKVKATGILSGDEATLSATTLEVTRAPSDGPNFNQFIRDWFGKAKEHGKDK